MSAKETTITASENSLIPLEEGYVAEALIDMQNNCVHLGQAVLEAEIKIQLNSNVNPTKAQVHVSGLQQIIIKKLPDYLLFKILKDHKTISPKEFKILDKLRNYRNTYAHNVFAFAKYPKKEVEKVIKNAQKPYDTLLNKLKEFQSITKDKKEKRKGKKK